MEDYKPLILLEPHYHDLIFTDIEQYGYLISRLLGDKKRYSVGVQIKSTEQMLAAAAAKQLALTPFINSGNLKISPKQFKQMLDSRNISLGTVSEILLIASRDIALYIPRENGAVIQPSPALIAIVEEKSLESEILKAIALDRMFVEMQGRLTRPS